MSSVRQRPRGHGITAGLVVTRPIMRRAPRHFWPVKKTYLNKVIDTDRANLIGYWPMNEASGSVAVDHSGQGNNGAYTGVTLGEPGMGDGLTSPLFDGANDFNNIYSAALDADFSEAAGTVAGWARVSSWDLTARRMCTLRVNASNEVALGKTTTQDQLVFVYAAGGTTKSVTDTSLAGSLAWFHVAITWDVAGDAMKAHINGVQVGATQTGLGVWAGSLAATTTNLGALATTPTQVWNGWLAHWMLYTTVLNAAQIAALATVTT